MTWPFHAQHKSAKRLTEKCPSASLMWTASRVLCDVHWLWDEELRCYKTHQLGYSYNYRGMTEWPATNSLSSLLRAVREDPRLAGEPTIRLIALHIAIEYVGAMVDERKI